jgi:hypothetical protein
MKTTTATYSIQVTTDEGHLSFLKDMPTRPKTQRGIKSQNNKLSKWVEKQYPNFTSYHGGKVLSTPPTVTVNQSVNHVLHSVTIVARFPRFVERIPCCFVINEGVNIEHLTHPIKCHIYVGICVINEGTHLTHKIIPSRLHFGGDCEDGNGHDLRGKC